MSTPETNKQKVLELLNILMNKRDYKAAEAYFGSDYVQHSPMISTGRDGLFNLVKA